MGTRLVFVIAILALVAGAAAQRDDRAADADGGTFIVVSITAFNQFTFDVKLKNPRTGYVHSVTVTVDVARLLRAGDRVRKRTRGREVILVPVGAPREEPELQPPPPPVRWPWEQPAEAAEPLPCTNLPCKAPPAPKGKSSREEKFRPSTVPATRSVRVASMQFLYDRGHAGHPSLPDGCDVLTSGSFTSGGIAPVVPLKIGGDAIVTGYADKDKIVFHGTGEKGVTTRFRGAVTLSGGVPRIVRQSGNLARDFERRTDFMGGGALLLYGGYEISQEDLCCCQAFVDYYGKTGTLDRSTCGFKAGQLVAGAQHIVVASRGDDVYVFAMQLGGRDIQRVLFDAGFTDAVVLDGGGGAFMLARDRISAGNPRGFVFNGRPGRPGVNSMRLCIRSSPWPR